MISLSLFHYSFINVSLQHISNMTIIEALHLLETGNKDMSYLCCLNGLKMLALFLGSITKIKCLGLLELRG